MSSVGQQRDRQALIAAEQHGAGDGSRPEPVAHAVDRRVEGAATLEGEHELDRARILEVAQRDPDEGQAALLDRRRRGRQQGSRGGEDRLGLLGGLRRGCATASRVRSRRSAAAARPCGTRGARRAAAGRGGPRARRRRRRGPPGDLRPRPSARCAPIERRRRPTWTGRGSWLCARAWSLRPAARPTIATSAVSASRATWPTLVIPRSRSLSAVIGPTPHSRSTGSGCRKASSPPGGTTSRPSGLATPLATLARNFVRATPTVIGRPTRSRTSRRRRTAMSIGGPEIRPIPRTSRKASSIESPSTSGDVSAKTSKTALLASE